MNYRREIDGLRALAVLPVIFFHAGFDIFSGGFVGVDVFFVISGYLITSIILTEKQAGTFSLIHFYERRARRILPALFFVMAACVPLAWLWLLPNDMKSFSQSLMAVSTYSSNVLFLSESGYFDTAAELKPLLHTWSLAVEEQFYLLFPLLLMLTWRFGKRWIAGLLMAGAFISLAAAHWGAFNKPAETFFLLPTRGWELLIGALIALHYNAGTATAVKTASSNNTICQAGSALGLAMISYAIFAFDKSTPFPSLYALVPTIGTALVILFASPQTAVGALLGNTAFVSIGLISYSAYLWHQPLFAFARHRSLAAPSVATLLLLSLAALVLAYISWRFVEQPFRRGERITRERLFAICGVLTIVFLSVGFYGDFTNGYVIHSDVNAKKLHEIEHQIRINYGLGETCEGTFTLAQECRTSDQPELLLWGDSYAMHLLQGFMASKPDLKVIQMTESVCAPMLGTAPINVEYTESWGRECIKHNDQILNWIESNTTVKYAALGSPFGQYVSPEWKLLTRDGTVTQDASVALEHFLKTLKTLKEHGITPVVFSPTPESGQDIGRCLAKARFLGINQDECNFDLEQSNQQQQLIIEFLKRVEGSGYKVIFLSDGLCGNGICRAAVGDTFIYRDGGHLSHEGSALLGNKMNFYKLITNK